MRRAYPFLDAVMADFFTHFSCVLDIGTPDNAARALKLCQAFMEDAAHEEVPPDGFPVDRAGAWRDQTLDSRQRHRRSPAGDPLRPALRGGLRSYRSLGLPMGERPLSATRQRLRRRRHVLDLETRETIAWTDTSGWLARTLATSRAKRRGR